MKLEVGGRYIVDRGDVPYYNKTGNRSTGRYLRQSPFKVLRILNGDILIRYMSDDFCIKEEDLKGIILEILD